MKVSLVRFIAVASVAIVVGNGYVRGACSVPSPVLEKLSHVDIDDVIAYTQESLRASTDRQIKTVLVMGKYVQLLCDSTTAHQMADAYQKMIATIKDNELFATDDDKTLAMFTFLEFYDVFNQLKEPSLNDTITSFIETFRYTFDIHEPKRKRTSTVQYGWASAAIMGRCDEILNDLEVNGDWTPIEKSSSSGSSSKSFLGGLCNLS